MEVSEPKWVNPDDIQYGVNSLRLGGLQILYTNCATQLHQQIVSKNLRHFYFDHPRCKT